MAKLIHVPTNVLALKYLRLRSRLSRLLRSQTPLPMPEEWIAAIAGLHHRRAPTDVPLHRWRQFVDDAVNFVTDGKNWPTRAFDLGWNALDLFGCNRIRPLDYLGSAGLVWAINGGRVIELYRRWGYDRNRRIATHLSPPTC